MDLFKANIFKGAIFKQAKYMISTPQFAQKAFLIREAGILSIEVMPVNASALIAHLPKMAWHSIQTLKTTFEGVDEPVLPISDRSRIPLDPFNKCQDDEELESLAALDVIAGIKYTEAFSQLADKDAQSPNAKMVYTLIWIISSLLAIAIIGVIIKA